MDTGCWLVNRRSAYGMEYGLGYQMAFGLDINFDLSIYYGANIYEDRVQIVLKVEVGIALVMKSSLGFGEGTEKPQKS